MARRARAWAARMGAGARGRVSGVGTAGLGEHERGSGGRRGLVYAMRFELFDLVRRQIAHPRVAQRLQIGAIHSMIPQPH